MPTLKEMQTKLTYVKVMKKIPGAIKTIRDVYKVLIISMVKINIITGGLKINRFKLPHFSFQNTKNKISMKYNINNTKFIHVVITLTLFFTSISGFGQQPGKPYVVMLSLDGFRWDYPARYHTPVLDSLAKAGVFAELIPSFPTKTFPNHYTIATGLYPDHHGIVLNSFHAVDLNRVYKISDRESVQDGVFYDGEPIWLTAKKQGVKNATLFWVGSEADVQHMHPDRWYPYDEHLPFENRIDSVKKWLSLPGSERPHLILWYYHEPDKSGHRFGPAGKETKKTVEQLDRWLGRFFTEMRKLKEFDRINFIITSDHGMGAITKEKSLFLDQLVDTALFEIIDGGNPVFNLKVKKGKLDEVYNRLKANPHLNVWKHNQLPQRLHYGHNIRTLDLTVAADTCWSIYLSHRRHYGNGTHGYDNRWRAMHAIFYAAGPAFKKGYRQPPFENVNIYPLIAHILHLKPVKTDGNLSNVQSMLK